MKWAVLKWSSSSLTWRQLRKLRLPPTPESINRGQAFSALLFLYREVLDQDFQAPLKNVRAREQRERLPNVLTKDEVKRLLAKMSGTSLLMARLLYGSGLRVLELCTLRVKDVDFEQHLIRVHDSKGDKDRVTVLPDSLLAPLKEHLSHVQQLHEKDLAKGTVRWPGLMP
jgi:integrase